MKKVLSYILISFILFANLFAPLSVGLSEKNKIEVKNNKAEAYDWLGSKALDGTDESPIKVQINPSSKDKEIRFDVNVKWGANSAFTTTTFEIKRYLDDSGKNFETKEPRMGPAFETVQSGYVVFDGLEPNTTYKFDVYLFNESMDYTQTFSNLISLGIGMDSTTGSLKNNVPYEVKTLPEITGGYTDFVKQGSQQMENEASLKETMPACGIDGLSKKGTVMGCVAQFVYYVLFVPTSYFFALSGVFFDNTFAYSVQDNSYRSSFVVQGWGLVRDFCNMFFIFILLYVAIGTTLSLHGINTKGTIINIVIIGLFINFSLFATQVIIDASNVTARVFYNSETIKVTVKGQTDNTLANAANGGSIIAEEKNGGVISLSEALVNKVNPQNIIINAKKVNSIPIKGGGNDVIDDQESNMGAGTFILITLLAIGINVVGIIVFLSVGLIFVSRVIGLWIAMILSPLAFFTYILPSMSGTKMIGWKNWWPETLKLAFLAPVFMFFMYIILKFLELDLIADPMSKDGLNFFIATLIPFAFIMILMLKAKGIAKDMSGELGQQITGGVAAAGGMMLGGAALGTAFLGRKIIGGGLAYASRTEGAKKIGAEKIKFNENLATWKQANPNATTGAPTWKEHKAQNGIKETPVSWIGAKLNEKQKKVNKLDHATHEIEEAKKAAGLVDSKGNVLADHMITGEGEENLKTNFTKSKRSDVETNAKKGLDATGKNEAKLTDEKGRGFVGEKAFKSKNREEMAAELKKDPNNLDKNGELKAEVQKKMEDDLDIKLNAAVKVTTDKQLTDLFEHVRAESKQGVSMLDRGFARSNKGSYDIRELSGIKAGKKDSFMSKIPTAMIAGVALGVRSGLKSSGIDHGKSQGDFMKDMGATITEALKGVKVDVPKASGGGHGGGGGHDDHAAGGHGGGGGGHH